MARGGKNQLPPAPPEDGTAWILDNGFAEFILMNTNEIKYMCMLGYTYLHGAKVFSSIGSNAPFSYKFINMIMACTGGGILVPIFINAIPVPLAQDAYPIAIFVSFLIHTYFPALREVLQLSTIFKAVVVFLYETLRAYVVVKMTTAAGNAIPASDFDFAIFGPIFCGSIAGCGGAFLPLNKGLDPIKEHGLAPPMFSAFVGATFFHLFTNLVSSDVIDAPKKAHVAVSIWFIFYGFYATGIFAALLGSAPPKVPSSSKKEKTKVKKEK